MKIRSIVGKVKTKSVRPLKSKLKPELVSGNERRRRALVSNGTFLRWHASSIDKLFNNVLQCLKSKRGKNNA